MRRLRYNVATSFDGFIAGPHGEYDWIVMDEGIDFEALYSEFDTVLMGRKTFEVANSAGGGGAMPGMSVIVFSRTLHPSNHPDVTVSASDPVKTVRRLKREPGKDIWLFGGGALFRTLLDAGVVDRVELAVMPVLLGEGVPLLPGGYRPTRLTLASSKVLPSGIMLLAYDVMQGET